MHVQKSAETFTLILFLLLGSIFSGGCQSNDISRLSNKQFNDLASKENTIIIDVRTPDEFKSGHLNNAILIDYLETDLFRKQIQTLDTSKTYLLYCRTGKRSLNAAKLMKENGFKMVSDLKGGISQWDGPVIKGSQ